LLHDDVAAVDREGIVGREALAVRGHAAARDMHAVLRMPAFGRTP